MASPRDNRAALGHLLATGSIRLERGPIVDATPGPLVGRTSWDRVEGMLYGLAIGDALGDTSEAGRRPSGGRAIGEIRDYLPNRNAGGRPWACPPTTRSSRSGRSSSRWPTRASIPSGSARASRGDIFGIGGTVRAFRACYGRRGTPWHACGQRRPATAR